MVGTVPNGVSNAYWFSDLHFTDGAGTDAPCDFICSATLYTDILRTGAAEFLIRAKRGQPIRFEVKSLRDTSGSKYNVWVVVEQLM